MKTKTFTKTNKSSNICRRGGQEGREKQTLNDVWVWVWVTDFF